MLELVALDDGYEPEKALANMHNLIDQRKVFAIIGNTGTPTAKLTVPFALKRKKLFFGAFTGAGLLRRDPPDRYVLNYRASYAEETAAMVNFFTSVKRIKPEEIAVFSQQDSFGDAGFSGVMKKLRSFDYDPTHMLHVRYDRNDLSVSRAVAQVLKEKKRIKAIVMVSTYKAAARFIKGVRDGGEKALVANVSFVGSRALADELMELGGTYAEGVIVTQVVPFFGSQSTGVLNYIEDLTTFYPQEQPGFISLEGYMMAKTLVEALNLVENDLTTEQLISAFESIKNLDLGVGSLLSFGPSKHQASSRVWGTVLDEKGNYQPVDLD